MVRGASGEAIEKHTLKIRYFYFDVWASVLDFENRRRCRLFGAGGNEHRRIACLTFVCGRGSVLSTASTESINVSPSIDPRGTPRFVLVLFQFSFWNTERQTGLHLMLPQARKQFHGIATLRLHPQRKVGDFATPETAPRQGSVWWQCPWNICYAKLTFPRDTTLASRRARAV